MSWKTPIPSNPKRFVSGNLNNAPKHLQINPPKTKTKALVPNLLFFSSTFHLKKQETLKVEWGKEQQLYKKKFLHRVFTNAKFRVIIATDKKIKGEIGMATINDILQARHINSSTPGAEPIFFVDGPYFFLQDGKSEKLEYITFSADLVEMKKFMNGNNMPYQTIVSIDAFKGDSVTPEEDMTLFNYEWISMYDQIVHMAPAIKDEGGMFVFPNPKYFEEKFKHLQVSRRDEIIAFRKEFSAVIRDCIAKNYYEAERLNKNLSDEHKIKLPSRTATYMQRVAEQEKARQLSGRGGK